ncbi:MAG: hypothetical protein AAF806_21755 [Bacteroidota bacterium]
MNTSYTKKSQAIIFHEKWVQNDLYRYLKKEDVLVLLNRLPLEEYEHLKSVTFKTCRGGNAYGRVYHKRSAGIIICDQSARTSIRVTEAKRGSLEEFGALNNMKWPTLAIRRFMLYDVFLHELKHTQLLKNGKKRIVDKIPLEKQAEEYAEYWRGELYQQHFDHPDPVHNLPSEAEKERLQKYWPKAMDFLQKGIRYKNRRDHRNTLLNYEQAIQQIKLYHGDLSIENEDIKKLGTMWWLRRALLNMDFGIISDASIYERILRLLKGKYKIKTIAENDYAGLFKVNVDENLYKERFRFVDFEFRSRKFRLSWGKNEGTSLQMMEQEMVDEDDLDLINEMKAVILEELQESNKEN